MSVTNTSYHIKTTELIENMFYAKDKYLIAFYVALVKKIIYQHGGGLLSRSKDIEELMRACNLYAKLPVHVKKLIDKDRNF